MKSFIIPYLLLVTFFGGTLEKVNLSDLHTINQSPYNGIAIRLIGQYDPNPPPTFEELKETFAYLVKNSKKDIWPWIFLNRIVGIDQENINPNASWCTDEYKKYFQKINGMDIYDQAGALKDFYEIWRLGLRLAKEFKSPGIVFDLELYNNGKLYNLLRLAKKMEKKPEEVATQLKKIGINLVNIALEEYPEAIIWILFDGFFRNIPNRHTLACIVEAMLETAKELKAPLKVVSGGEIGIGYCHESLRDLEAKIVERDQIYKPLVEKYAPILQLGGTIAPWDNAKKKKGWMLKDSCGQAPFRNINDFKPLFKKLFQAYNYVWIYAASAAGYNPWNPKIAKNYNTVIGQVLYEIRYKNTSKSK